jgi:hypothetical protein
MKRRKRWREKILCRNYNLSGGGGGIARKRHSFRQSTKECSKEFTKEKKGSSANAKKR